MSQSPRVLFPIAALSILMLSVTAAPAHAMRVHDDTAIRSSDGKVVLSSEDVVVRWPWMTNVVAAATTACHANTSCGSAYTSCAGWSSLYDCDDPYCGIAANCSEDPDCTPGPTLCAGPALRQKQEKYRICFDQQGNPCTEYQISLTKVLGCGC
jgi:hypothetical protein